MCPFAVKTYSIVCIPLNTPTVLYLQHHRAISDGWESLVLCNDCLKEILSILQPIVGNCTFDPCVDAMYAYGSPHHSEI